MRIAIITGGVSGERDVSINSAKNLQTVLNLDDSVVFVFPEDQASFQDRIAEFHIAIPIIHGVGGEDGAIQEYLESVNLPYLFSNPRTHKSALDKRFTKQVAKDLGINIATEIVGPSPTFPLFAKPNFGGSSIASQLCTSTLELQKLMQNNPSEDFLLEEPVLGREFTVGVIQHHGVAQSLPVVEIISHNGVFDYQSKYDSEYLAEEICPANIHPELEKTLKESALLIHNSIGAKHLTRSDFMVSKNGKVYFLEINTIPGLTKTSLIPKMLLAQGVDIRSLFLGWCDETLRRLEAQ